MSETENMSSEDDATHAPQSSMTGSSVASPRINSRYANIFMFIDCENNELFKEMNNENNLKIT